MTIQEIPAIETMSPSDAGQTVRRAQADEFNHHDRSLGYLAEATTTHLQTGSTHFVIGSGRITVQWLYEGILLVSGSSAYNQDQREAQQEATVFNVHVVIREVCNHIREQSLADMLIPIADQAILRHLYESYLQCRSGACAPKT